MSLPTFHFVEIDTADQESRLAADRENAARSATVEIQQDSVGIGQYRLSKPVIFPIVFRSEPHFTSGSGVLRGPDTRTYNDPRGSSGVWGWKRNASGYYVGAYLWLRVEIDLLAGQDGSYGEYQDAVNEAGVSRYCTVRHYLTFTGVAIKDLPTQQLTPALTPRTVGLP